MLSRLVQGRQLYVPTHNAVHVAGGLVQVGVADTAELDVNRDVVRAQRAALQALHAEVAACGVARQTAGAYTHPLLSST